MAFDSNKFASFLLFSVAVFSYYIYWKWPSSICLVMDNSDYFAHLQAFQQTGAAPPLDDFSLIMQRVGIVEFVVWLLVQAVGEEHRVCQRLLYIFASIFAWHLIPWNCAIHKMPLEMRWYRIWTYGFGMWNFIKLNSNC